MKKKTVREKTLESEIEILKADRDMKNLECETLRDVIEDFSQRQRKVFEGNHFVPESQCSVWSFVVPALLILLIGFLFSWNSLFTFKFKGEENEMQHYVTDTQSRIKTIGFIVTLSSAIPSNYEQIKLIELASADLENGHWAKADRELHSLKLQLEGK
jgi:hypothetical protein